MSLDSLLFIVANQCSRCLLYALKLVRITYYFQLTNLIVITIIWKLQCAILIKGSYQRSNTINFVLICYTYNIIHRNWHCCLLC